MTDIGLGVRHKTSVMVTLKALLTLFFHYNALNTHSERQTDREKEGNERGNNCMRDLLRYGVGHWP
jgi:hypothetical protein